MGRIVTNVVLRKTNLGWPIIVGRAVHTPRVIVHLTRTRCSILAYYGSLAEDNTIVTVYRHRT